MQIDFHHAATYILARWAGFSHEEADIIAYSAQYVDDSTYAGTVQFEEGPSYHRTASAHEVFDIRNALKSQDIRTWVPFHFLPGNCNKASEEICNVNYFERLRCVADSHVAQDMLQECLNQRGKQSSLHRLGITMHVYADTWAHQNFAGIDKSINDASDLEVFKPANYNDILDEMATISPTKLGHAQVSCCPDYPYIEWNYTDSKGIRHIIVNADRCIQAADKMLEFMKKWRNTPISGLNNEQKEYLVMQFKTIQDKDGEERHEAWVNELRAGSVPGISGVALDYAKNGPNSWKWCALGTDDEASVCGGQLSFAPDFMSSNWKLFHDALQFHRLFVLNDLLPRYGICAA